MARKKIKNIVLIVVILLLQSFSMLFAHGDEDHGTSGKVSNSQIPYAEGSTKNFEVVINYNDVLPNKETKLTVYVSDFKTNSPVENAKVLLEITGVDNSKIQYPVSTSPGVYEFMVEFPEIKKYDFLVSISKGDIDDLIPINGVDLLKKEENAPDNTIKQTSFISKVLANLFLIIIILGITIIIAFIFYRIGVKSKGNKMDPPQTESK